MGSFSLKESFFRRDTHKVAKELLGKVLIRIQENGRIQAGVVVEVEAYHGFEDKASHAAKARTQRTEVMFGPGGCYYVYLIYGMYWNLNIVSGVDEFPSAILIRALEPIFDSKVDLQKLTFKEKFKLASGPGKLCRWMGIDKKFYGRSVENDDLFIVELKDFYQVIARNGVTRQSGGTGEIASLTFPNAEFEIVTDKRIGVSYAKESADWDWRYYIKGNKFVSK